MLRSRILQILRYLLDGGIWKREVATYPLPGEDELPRQVISHPGMISTVERRLLFGLARDRYQGKGVIVDAGVFLGASTLALGEGLRDNPAYLSKSLTPLPIRSFERGIAGPNFAHHTRKAGLRDIPLEESFENLLRQQLEPVQSFVNLTIGDIRDYNGADIEDIEICFLDILKTAEVTRHVMRVFFPRLQPGAIIVQQDYFFSGLPFIKVYNEALSHKLAFLGEVRSSAVFEVTDRISAEEVEDAFTAFDTVERSLQLHRIAEERTESTLRQYLMRISRAVLYANADDPQMAAKTLSEANKEFSDIAYGPLGIYRPSLRSQMVNFQNAIKRAEAVELRRAERAKRQAAANL